MNKAVRGIYAAAVSPFNKDGALDAKKLVNYCEYLVTKGGCDGVAPTGTTGEGNSISFIQKLKIAEVFADAKFEPSRVIFGTGSCATQDAVDLSKAMIDAGYPNVLVLPPFYYKNPSNDGLYAYYSELIESVGNENLRVYIYHFPQVSMTPIPVDVVVKLKNAYGPIVAGLKDSSGDINQALAFASATGGVKNDFDVYPSSEALLFQGLEGGCAGIISGSTNAFGNYVQQALKDGSDSKSFELVKAARAVASKYPLMAAMKQVEAWRSNDDTWTKMAAPLVKLDSEQKNSLKSDMDNLAELASGIE
ncbi:dihydrodipicolinate synthase family protein [Paracoccaceae bacterium]|nr:dihydrodipicolinate synthase family protein [Paracoccaceae bacterium]